MSKSDILIKQLIQIPSISGEEKHIQEFIFGWLAEVGLEPMWQGENVVVRIAGQDKSRALIFNAHVDTVSPGDLGSWTHDPFAGQIINGKIYGLGASDEKAGVASLLLLGKRLHQHPPACDVWLTFVVGEEVDGKGTREFVKWMAATRSQFHGAYEQIAAVLVEPTGLETVEIGHKGNVFVKLTIKGDSGHGSRPAEIKINSVLVMGQVLESLQKLNQVWAKKYRDSVLGSPTLGVGTSIIAGNQASPNKFADTCMATVDVRTVPAMHEQVLEILKKHLVKYPVELEYLFEPCGFGLTKRSDDLVRTVEKVIPGIELGISPGATDQCFLSQVGIPAIVIGPGEKSCMHIPDEWCYVTKITQAVKLYKQIVEQWGKISS